MVNKKVVLIGLIVMIFLLGVISVSAETMVYPQNRTLDLKVPCFNNNTFCSGGAACNITIFHSNDSLLINNRGMTNQNSYFNYTLSNAQTSEVGYYKQYVTCWDGDNGFTASEFKITPKGIEGTTQNSILYVVLLLVCLVLMIISFVGAIKIDGRNTYDMGKLIELNYGKYAKMGLFFLSYLMLWFMTYFAWQVADTFLMFDFVAWVFRFGFIFLAIMLGPLLFVIVILSLLKWLADLRMWKWSERNLPIRGDGRR